MNKTKLLTIFSIVLLAINLMLVGFILFKTPLRKGSEGPRDIIIEKLHFNNDQTIAYDTLISLHRIDIREQDQIIRQLKNNLYSALNSPFDTLRNDSLITLIGNAQQNIERIHYHHFQDIKKLCKPEQQKSFEALTKELSSMFNRGPKRPKDK